MRYTAPLIFLIMMLLTSCQSELHRSEVVNKIQNCSRLSTTEFIVSKLIFAKKDKKLLFINEGEAHFAAKTYAKVKAGIDLNKLSSSDIKIEGKRIEVFLPPVELFYFSYPPSSYDLIKQFSSNTLLTKMTVEDEDELFRQAELEIRASLKYINHDHLVRNKTRRVLKGLLRNLGFTEIFINFKPQPLNVDQKAEIG